MLLVIPRVRKGRALGLEVPGPVDGPVTVQHEAAVTPSQRCKHTGVSLESSVVDIDNIQPKYVLSLDSTHI